MKEQTETGTRLVEAYKAIRGEDYKDILEKAKAAVVSLFPQVESDSENAWRALTEKPAIKSFYMDFVSADYAKEKGYDIENDPGQKDQALKDVRNALYDFFKSIKGNPNEGGTKAFSNFLQELKDYDIKNDFQCDLLPADNSLKPINFPKSTLNIIAGRPSAGKTTALASIALYAMRNTDKKVLFITSEETPQQLFVRFVKNEFYNICSTTPGLGSLLSEGLSESYINDTFKDVIKKGFFPEKPELFNSTPLKPFPAKVMEAARKVQGYVESGRLQIYNLDKTTSFEELKEALLEQQRHTIIILDYIQNLPYAPADVKGQDRLEALRSEIYTFNQIVKMNELIGIAGAQFNRDGASEYAPDTLELNKLGDSGEIERKASVLIGLGRMYDEERWIYFYRVLKNREGDTSAAHFEIKNGCEYPYSFLAAKTCEGPDGKPMLVKRDLKKKSDGDKTKKEKSDNPKGSKESSSHRNDRGQIVI